MKNKNQSHPSQRRSPEKEKDDKKSNSGNRPFFPSSGSGNSGKIEKRILKEVEGIIDKLPCYCEMCAFEGRKRHKKGKLISYEEIIQKLNKLGGKAG